MYDHFVSLDVGLKKYIWVSTARTVNMCSIKSIPMQKKITCKAESSHCFISREWLSFLYNSDCPMVKL